MKWFNKIKEKPWFQITIALAIVVLLYFVLQHLGTIWNFIKIIWNIIVPLFVGLIIAYIIDPLVRLFERTVFKKIKKRNAVRGISIGISIVLVLAALVVLLWLLIPQLIESIQTLIGNISTYMSNLETWLKSIGGGIFEEQLEEIDFSSIGSKLINLLTTFVSAGDLVTTSVSIGSGIASFVMSAILAVYFLISKNKLINISKRVCRVILKEKAYTPFISFCSNCNKILVKYVCCSLLEAIMVGVANAILMLIFGMPYIPIVSIVVGVTNLVPTFGPIAGCIIGGFILLMVNPVDTLIFVIFTIVLQMIDGYIVKPRLFSGTLGVSALLILISIIVLGRIFGIVGILFAIPIAAILQYLFKEISADRARKKKALDENDAENPENQK